MMHGAGPGAPEGGPRTGPGLGRRLAALAALGAFCGLGALAWGRVAEGDAPHRMVGLELPRIELHRAAPCSAMEAVAGRVDFEAPGVVMYISNSCPHCRAQLQAWAHLLAERGSAPPWVVIAPDEMPDTAVLPPRLRRRVALDRDARIARLLEARRVPLTVYVDRHRRVVARVEGRQGGAEMVRLLGDIGLGSSVLSTGDCP